MKGTLVIITAIVVLGVSFLLFTNITPLAKGYPKAKGYLADMIGPVLRGASAPARAVGGLFEGYVNLIDLKRKNNELKQKLATLQLENQKIPELEKENGRLKGLLRLVDQRPGTLTAARVIGEDVTNWFKCLIIDKGRQSGVKERMPVITPSGVVGQAVEVSAWHTKVMIINDTNSSLDVSVTGKETRGILEGTGGTTLRMKYVLKNENIDAGDKLVTSGKDGVYPRGLPVGIVISVNKNKAGLFADIEVMPYNNFKRLDEVLVIKR